MFSKLLLFPGCYVFGYDRSSCKSSPKQDRPKNPMAEPYQPIDGDHRNLEAVLPVQAITEGDKHERNHRQGMETHRQHAGLR